MRRQLEPKQSCGAEAMDEAAKQVASIVAERDALLKKPLRNPKLAKPPFESRPPRSCEQVSAIAAERDAMLQKPVSPGFFFWSVGILAAFYP